MERVHKPLVVETNETIYDIELCQIEIEITDRCNMLCQHCRVGRNGIIDMPVDQIVKIMQFAQQYSDNSREIVISGGEPLLHRSFSSVLKAIRQGGGGFVALTTNGFFLRETHFDLIGGLDFEEFTFSVSLDSLNPAEHDEFRVLKGSFEKTVEALRLIVKHRNDKLHVSMRTTLRPHQISQMRDLSDFAYNIGCDRIMPAGRALDQKVLWMDCDQKRQFIEQVHELNQIYPSPFVVRTNDPLKCLMIDYEDNGESDEVVFGGCIAGSTTFNIRADGTMTPCALLDVPMMNISNMTIEEIAAGYQACAIVKNMLDMNLKGKCGKCSKKYQCGGCRARALAHHGDYLAEDPDCWLE